MSNVKNQEYIFFEDLNSEQDEGAKQSERCRGIALSASESSDRYSYRTKKAVKAPRYEGKPRPVCGCGCEYSCTSALYYHIRLKHNGIIPAGTLSSNRPGQAKSIFQKSLECECGQVFPNFNALSKHITQHNSSRTNFTESHPGFCQNVNSQELSAPTKKQLKLSKKKQLFSCVCTLRFESFENLKSHAAKCHPKGRNCLTNVNMSESDESELESMASVQKPTKDFKEHSKPVKRQQSQHGSLQAPEHENSKGQTKKSTLGSTKPTIQDLLAAFEGRSYVCGCVKSYPSSACLTEHILNSHEGLPPDGTMYGIKKKAILQELDLDSENQDSDFIDPEQIKVLRHQIGDRKRLGKFACGCGKKYNTNAALKYHVRTKHEGVQPENNNCQSTKGSRKGESGIDAIRKGTKI